MDITVEDCIRRFAAGETAVINDGRVSGFEKKSGAEPAKVTAPQQM